MPMAAITNDVRVRLEANGGECGIEEVVALCPDLTWNQVFLAVDHLSRAGQVRLRRNRAGGYQVKILSTS